MSEKESNSDKNKIQRFWIELLIMIIVGILVILPLALYSYHFFI